MRVDVPPATAASSGTVAIKIVHVISGLSTGGAEMMLYKLLSRLNQASFTSAVVSLVPIGPMGEKIQALNVPVRTLGMRRKIPNPAGLYRLARWPAAFPSSGTFATAPLTIKAASGAATGP